MSQEIAQVIGGYEHLNSTQRVNLLAIVRRACTCTCTCTPAPAPRSPALARARPLLAPCHPHIPHVHSVVRVQVTVYALFTLRVRRTTYKHEARLAWGKAPVHSDMATKYLPAAVQLV